MSILAGAVGAGAILAILGHEASLAREADEMEEERVRGQYEALMRESEARGNRLQEMRGITRAGVHGAMMRRGVMPMHGGRGAGAVYLSEMARSQPMSPGKLMMSDKGVF